MASRLGVDVGGTFTDLIFYDDASGDTRVVKAPTTPERPEQGILRAVGAAVADERLADAGLFLHGTTVGLNALLERRGALVGLLSTRGFRDVLELRRGDRGAMYDVFWKPPEPLVPRRLRVPITERMLAGGVESVPLDVEEVRAAARLFQEEGVTAVAIAFLHAYSNGEHERAAARILRESGFAGELSLSHDVSGEYREYERTTTTVIDAFVRARMARYLDRLGGELGGRGFDGDLLVTRSGGGAMTFREAAERPFETIMSGPVAGAEGASEMARALGLQRVIAADVGGTSFDTCLIMDGRPTTLYEGEVVGLPVQAPWVDVRSIGAGGGSIAHVDAGRLLRVGPRSAGALPGPACYGRGGTEPTVTDAALVLGMLGDGLLAGDMRLDREAAQRAIEPLCDQLDMSVGEIARGILTIAAASMSGAIREITVEQGQDPRESVLMPFGGAGPLFLSLMARELGIREIVVPPHAGNFSAWGLLGADLTQTIARTRITPLTAAGVHAVGDVLDDLFAQLSERAAHAGAAGSRREVRLDMRYVGQEHSLTVLVEIADGQIAQTADDLALRFRDEYRRTFALEMDERIEIVTVRATITAPLPRGNGGEPAAPVAGGAPSTARSAQAFSFADGAWTEFAMLDRESLGAGATFAGPALVFEPTSTAYIDRGFAGRVHESGCIVLQAVET